MHPATTTIRTPEDAASLGTVLGVWAHPDDETYLSSGLMALSRRAGRRVVCVTATRGEHGTSDVTRWPPERLARTRDLEVLAAMAVLGVAEHRCLGLEDGTLDGLPCGVGVDIASRLLDEVQPDTIVTFGPDGMTGHADHRTVSAWVTGAWAASGRPGRLLRATTTEGFADEFADVHAVLPVFGAGLPLRTPAPHLSVLVDLDDELCDVKLAALRAQATQVAPIIAAIGEDRFRTWWRHESFRSPDPGA